MQTRHRLIIGTVAALQVLGGIVAIAAHADSRQDNKNFWRNATIGSGAVAAYGLTHHKDTLTIAGAAGAVYSGLRYESDRRSQSQQNAAAHGHGWYYEGHDRDRRHNHGRWHGDNGHHYGWDKHGHHPGHDWGHNPHAGHDRGHDDHHGHHDHH